MGHDGFGWLLKIRNNQIGYVGYSLNQNVQNVGSTNFSDFVNDKNRFIGPEFESLTDEQRGVVWEGFNRNYDKISEIWNDRGLGITTIGLKFLRALIGATIKTIDGQNTASNIFVYQTGIESLNAYRKYPPTGHHFPSRYGEWSLVSWGHYDFNGTAPRTVDFYLWTNNKTDLRPADCSLSGNC